MSFLHSTTQKSHGNAQLPPRAPPLSLTIAFVLQHTPIDPYNTPLSPPTIHPLSPPTTPPIAPYNTPLSPPTTHPITPYNTPYRRLQEKDVTGKAFSATLNIGSVAMSKLDGESSTAPVSIVSPDIKMVMASFETETS